MSDKDLIRRGNAKNAIKLGDTVEALQQRIDSIPAVHFATSPGVTAGAASPDVHVDDHCIRQFAKTMSDKMAASRAKGRSGWDDANQCSVDHLRSCLYDHLDKGDPVDVANFCMMLHHRGASTCSNTLSPDVQALVDALEPFAAGVMSEENRHRAKAALSRVKGGGE